MESGMSHDASPWIGIEIENSDSIVERIQGNAVSAHRNSDFVEPPAAVAVVG